MINKWQICQCKECECMNMKDVASYDSSKRFCSERNDYCNPNDKACSSMIYKQTQPESSHGYLTTIINLLGVNDDNHIFITLKKFRDEYILNHPETYPILIEYDIVGPKIATELERDTINMYIAREFYVSHIKPIILHIEHEEYGIAMLKCQDMTNKLRNHYHIDDIITKKLNINIKTLGKMNA